MQTYDTRLGKKFAELIADQMATITQAVMNGSLKKKDYKKETGRFNGLREALEIYEEAEATIKGAERS
ncbi:hypothetical protein UFOVP1413_38 [uncultured Caudovirales phage]|mgnify:CR=1 FL=1|jgi:hypothetical protein|uniref:Uncharacterized protein n=1 Tax=uncultured Caudovirales phage TaxID=2100421 RepID=A0A6J5PDM1_9CAUD|nr:hypothetical protein UFOVP893_66 [uncultured Caudovirales phage]CAB4210672.1 hypothetical protein UFOVP1413_38 [uncultured Caudovirales phage]